MTVVCTTQIPVFYDNVGLWQYTVRLYVRFKCSCQKTPNMGAHHFGRFSISPTLPQPDVGRLVSRLFVIEIRSKVVPKDAMKANTGVEIKLHLFVTSALCGDECSSLTSQANAQIKELSSLNRLQHHIFLSLLT
jgi:hypothetical protein